jgi:hypothetical protein
MSAPINYGGPAFPMPSGPEPRVESTTHYNEGMTLRDYFALGALPVAWQAYESMAIAGDNPNQELAQAAYQLADAMLIAREAKC